MAQVNYANVHSFLLEGNTPYYWAMGFVIGIATVIGGLYFTKVGKKHLRSYWSIAVGTVAVAILCALVMAKKHRQQCWRWIAEAPAWAKTIQAIAIPTAAIEMRIDEDMELEIQAPQIGVAIPTASIEMGRDENVELEIQAPQIGVAIENEESDDVSFNPV
ncbi:hypothetical protein Acr_08g0018100 [Actinidia rufa]|uniref:Uncharacterized protein n=1 Tax=Actinidia rufa TaxID=165716 RepID=A0A7J0F410_9ERIC|nr:hypothetical protein Acr_08g0018100 [Actinidia rufa]